MNELQVFDVKVIAKEGSIQFSNYEELKEMVNETLTKYKGLKLTEENKQEIKGIMANLNKTKKALDDERKRVEKEYIKPLDLLKVQVKEIIGILDDARTKLDGQVTQAENEEKQAKSDEVELYFNELVEFNNLGFIKFKDMNLNVTLGVTVTNLKKQVKEKVDGIVLDLEEIKTDPNAERLGAKYFISKDLQKSRIELNKELQQEAELKKALKDVKEVEEEIVTPAPFFKKEEPKIEEVFDTIVIKLKNVTRNQAKKVRDFIESEGIRYE